jgi:hypothetical protein
MDYAEANGLFFTETSAKTAQNVSELFYELGKCLLSQLQFCGSLCCRVGQLLVVG